ncbi:MAG: hypothetical protein AAF702_07010 [Chloroflexota bacterium]
MNRIAINEVLDQLPIEELESSLNEFLSPIIERMPEKRLGKVVPLSVQGILGSESPVVLQMAQAVSSNKGETWSVAKRMYGLLWNERLSHEEMSEGLYAISQENVGRANPEYLVIAVDPVNFEKPYTEKLEGVSTVYKSTPAGPNGQARLTSGYPSITASVVNTPIPATTYANWFSYQKDFLSENVEIQRAFDCTNRLFPSYRRRYVMDAGFDDKRWFNHLKDDEFAIRASHFERIIEIYNERLERWEPETLGDMVDTTLFTHKFRVNFTHARKVRLADLDIGWFRFRLPGTEQELWAIVTYEEHKDRTLVLITNVPLLALSIVRSVYDDWRQRGRIEHAGAPRARFDQEQGLDVEDMRVQTLERMKRLFILVLAAAQFVFFLIDSWPQPAILWIRYLGGKLGLDNDLDGPYLVLRGLASLFQALSTLSYLRINPFPRQHSTYR